MTLTRSFRACKRVLDAVDVIIMIERAGLDVSRRAYGVSCCKLVSSIVAKGYHIYKRCSSSLAMRETGEQGEAGEFLGLRIHGSLNEAHADIVS